MSGPWNSLMSDPSHSWRSDLVIDRGKSMDNFSLEEMAEKLGELMRPIFWIWGPKIVAAVICVVAKALPRATNLATDKNDFPILPFSFCDYHAVPPTKAAI